jgi:hypothetical protein
MARGAEKCLPGCTCARHRYYGNGDGKCRPCRNRKCVRPSHLESVTTKENWERSRPYRDHLNVRDAVGRFAEERG